MYAAPLGGGGGKGKKKYTAGETKQVSFRSGKAKKKQKKKLVKNGTKKDKSGHAKAWKRNRYQE